MHSIRTFLRDERGAVSLDAFVVLWGTSCMLVTVAVDINGATVELGDRINNELRYNEVIYDILEGYGPWYSKVRSAESEL